MTADARPPSSFVERRAAPAVPAALPLDEVDAQTFQCVQAACQCARDGDAGRLAGWLDQGLSPDLCNERGDSLLMLAAYHGRADAVQVLLQHGADPDLANDRGQLPLAGAAFKGHGAVMQLLLDRGAQVDAAGPDGRTPLFVAAMFDRVEAVALLLARGADPAHRDAQGETAADAACRMGAEGTARLLRPSLDAAG